MTERHLRDTVQFLQWQMRSRDPKELASFTQHTVHSSLWSRPVPAPLFPTFLQVAFVWWKAEEEAQQWTKADLHPLTSRDRAD